MINRFDSFLTSFYSGVTEILFIRHYKRKFRIRQALIKNFEKKIALKYTSYFIIKLNQGIKLKRFDFGVNRRG